MLPGPVNDLLQMRLYLKMCLYASTGYVLLLTQTRLIDRTNGVELYYRGITRFLFLAYPSSWLRLLLYITNCVESAKKKGAISPVRSHPQSPPKDFHNNYCFT